MQNVYAMRPEVRAEFAGLRERLDGDAAFLTRLERFFTELRDPLVELYGGDPGARSAAPPPGPRARDHPGLAAARAGGRLRVLRRPLRGHARRGRREAAVPP